MDIKDMLNSLPATGSDVARKALKDANLVPGFVNGIARVPPLFVPPVDQNLASEFHRRLIKWINDFDAELDVAHEVGLRLVNFGQEITFHLNDISYWNPSLISFSGHTEEGDPVVLIQHVTQISVLLKKMKRSDPSLPKKPIGFIQVDQEQAG